MIMDDVLNCLNLPIIIWKSDPTGIGSYVCDYVNRKVDMVKKGDDVCLVHTTINVRKLFIDTNKSSFDYRLKDEIVCFSKLPNNNYIEFRYPYLNNIHLLSTISKKIREPLTDFIGIQAILEQTPLSERTSNYIPVIKQSCYNLIYLANDLVDLIYIDNNSIKIIKSKFDLAELSKQSLEFYQEECQNKNINLVLKIELDVPTIIWTDRSRLRQVIVILLKNAITNTSEGTIQLFVLTKQNKLVIQIKDSGTGLSVEKRKVVDRILNICHHSSQLQHEGFGLFIAKKISQAMSAKISYKSEFEMGSMFSIILTSF